MTCPAPSRGVYLTYLIQGLILIASAASILAGEYLLGLSAGLAFLLTLAPAIVTRNLRLCLPWEISLFIAVSLYLHIMGLAGGYYVSLAPYYDKLTHLVSSAAIAFIAFFIAIIAGQRGEIRLTTPTSLLHPYRTLAAGDMEIAEFDRPGLRDKPSAREHRYHVGPHHGSHRRDDRGGVCRYHP